MALRIKKGTEDSAIISVIEERSGVNLSLCYQCKKCSSGCPVAAFSEMPPSEVLRKMHLGAGKELLDTDMIWHCVSCETCYARCPMGIDISAVMDELRKMTVEKGAALPAGKMPMFNKAFLKTVEMFGRSYDIAMIAAYKVGSMNFFGDVEKFPGMLRKRKIALLPPFGSNRKLVKRIFKKIKD